VRLPSVASNASRSNSYLRDTPEKRARETFGNAIRGVVPEWSLSEVVATRQAVRGIDLIAAVGVLAEIGDLSRFKIRAS